MRMKDDHMGNGQAKAAYNIQAGTENQFMVSFSMHQKTTDTSFLIPHMKTLKNGLKGFTPENVTADAGYGSEENYEYLEKENINAYVKYNSFHLEQKDKFKKDLYRVENLKYDKEKDEYICPQNKKLKYKETKKIKTINGYLTSKRVYECEDCTNCSDRDLCHKSKFNRSIKTSFKLNNFRKKVRKNLFSEKGIKLRKKRCVEIESVFGQIKQNMGFRRFSLRGLEKVEVEFGLIGLAHNFKKIASLSRN